MMKKLMAMILIVAMVVCMVPLTVGAAAWNYSFRIVKEGTNDPIAGATVTVDGITATSDNNGEAIISTEKNLVGTFVSVRAMAEGYQTYEQETNLSTTNTIDLKAHPGNTSPYVVNVYTQEGTAKKNLKDATVTIGTVAKTTDASGNATFPIGSIKHPNPRVTVQRDGYATVFPTITLASDGTIAPVSPLSVEMKVTALFNKDPYTVHVYTKEGTSQVNLKDATVTIGTVALKTDANGNATFPRGSIIHPNPRVTVQRDGYVTVNPTITLANDGTITPTSPLSVEMKVTSNAAPYTVHVYTHKNGPQENLQGAAVTIGTVTLTTDANGNATFPAGSIKGAGAASQEIAVKVTATGYITKRRIITLYDTGVILPDDPFSIMMNADGVTVPTYKLSGTVTDKNGNPLRGATVKVESDPVTTVTNANGGWEVAVEAGNHKITVIYNGSVVYGPEHFTMPAADHMHNITVSTLPVASSAGDTVSPNNSANPKTGDKSNAVLFAVLSMAALGAAAFTAKKSAAK